mmetsp:Transcript_38963/g.154190  ORF Transcript_38963/g.154190 Transcript_38963/m.154190 type:complete len:286 (+) Transcript_38963:1027-1884(+)
MYHSSEILSIQKKGINALLVALNNPDLKEASLISFANRPRAMQRIRSVLGYFPRDVVPKDGIPGPAKYENLNQSEMPASESAQPSLEQGSGSASYSIIQLTEPEELDELLQTNLAHALSVPVGVETSYASVTSDGDVLEVGQAETQQGGADATPTPDVAPPSTSDVAVLVPPLATADDTRQTRKDVASEPRGGPEEDEYEEVEEVIEYEVVGDATSLHVILVRLSEKKKKDRQKSVAECSSWFGSANAPSPISAVVGSPSVSSLRCASPRMRSIYVLCITPVFVC